MPGPVPKRSEERARRNLPVREIKRAVGAAKVVVPVADKNWHPIAKKLWQSMKESGQTRFFEPSDWAFAYSTMEDLTTYKKSMRRSPQMLTAINSALGSLLVTEADRRRVQIELDRPLDEDGDSEGAREVQHWMRELHVVK